ncbi:lysylphosphatidylglycerol synthase transmembrane domain-containing protein [Amnibacterium sp.]|uniref:lysylphosphatidylglycerol synthase transmembrane domain-containing protein n=1 Tax=Amnibacterium sp. TaxID=1872496 RepID=UPI002603609A|nr:lysylphosphatidylglycerol synthase transmembrane domain-containing protein [Amnibacterium sp.]
MSAPRPASRRRLRRAVGIAVPVVVIALTVWLVVLPQLGAATRTAESLQHLSPGLVAIAALLEAASLASYSALTAVVLGSGRPTYFTLLRIDLADLAVNHAVPGGGTTSGAVRMRFFRQVGIPLADAFTTATVEILGSNVILGVIFASGIALSLPTLVGNAYYLVAGIAVLVVLAASAVGLWALVGRTSRTVTVVRAMARPIPKLTPVRAEAFVRTMAGRLRSFGAQPKRLAAAGTLGAANWLLDAAALGVLLAAFGHPVPVGALATVYGLGSILQLVPLTPGGLGLVEGVMVPAFVAFGVPAGPALLGVIGWRLLQFWAPLPIGLLAYGSLRLGPLRGAGGDRRSRR